MKLNHIHKALIIISILLVSATVEAQWELENFPELEGFHAPDSLRQLSYEALRELHNHNSNYFHENGDLNLAKAVAYTLLQKGVFEKDSLNVGRAYLWLGRTYNNLNYFHKAYDFTKNSDNIHHPSNSLIGLTQYYYNIGNYQSSIKYALQSYHSCKEKNNLQNLIVSKDYINLINMYWGNRTDAIKAFKTKQLSLKNGELDIYYTSEKKKYEETASFYSRIAESYFLNKDYTNALKYLDTLYQIAVKADSKIDIDIYLGSKGGVLFRQGNYAQALEYTNAFLYNNQPNEPYGISRSNVIKGLTLWELGAKEEAMQSLKIADSIYQETRDEYEELGEGYHKMIFYYKEKGNAVKELEYVNKLLDFNEEITSNYLEIAPAIQRAYTIPKLLEDKEALIAKLDKSNTSKEILNTILLLISVVLVVIGAVFAHNNHRYRKRYDKLLKDFEEKRYPTLDKRSAAQKELKELDAAQINLISGGLEKFELDERFIDKEITLKVMAKEIGTNSSYLSKYINAVKGENYSHYIGNLRIAYAIDHLTRVPKWRTYTIEAIGNEVGFATARSFTTHFKRVTGLNVSYFLKRLIRQDEKTATITEAPIPQTE